MPATRIAHALPVLALVSAAGLATPALAGPTTTHWAAPVSGSLFDPAMWENGIPPSATVGAIIDAVGSPYTVTWAPAQSAVRSILIDSHDARLLVYTSGLFEVLESLDVRQGRFTCVGRLTGGELRIGPNASMDVVTFGSSIGRGAVLSMNVVNENAMTIEGEAYLTQSDDPYGEIPVGISITNSTTGIMRLVGANIVTRTTLHNYGLIEVENDPDFEAPYSGLHFDGSALGYQHRYSEGNYLSVTNNHGVVRLHQRDLVIEGSGEHSGVFELLSADSTLQFRGEHTFQPGMSITGPGLTRLYNPDTMSGSIQTEGNLELFENGLGHPVIDLVLDVDGDLILNLSDTPTFTNTVHAGRITGETYGITFAADADVVFAEPYGSAEFLGKAIIRGDHLGGESVFHASTRIMGSVKRSEFLAAATIDADASEVVFAQGAAIGGNLIGRTEGVGAFTVAGDVIANTGAWLFSTPQGAVAPTRLDVAGNVDIATSFTMQGDLTAGGAFSTIGGRFESITADTIDFNASSIPAGAIVRLRDGATLTSREARTRIANTLVRTDPTGGALGTEEIVFASGFEMITPSDGSSDGAGLGVIVNAFTTDATTFVFFADSLIAGNLSAAVLGDAALLNAGDSFLILEGRTPSESSDPLPTLTGEFDRLFLPSLSGGLFFDVVYEPSAVRLVVVPTPGASALLAIGFLGRRRRARTP